MTTRQHTEAREAVGLKYRVGALRQAAGMPDAEPRALLDAALAELDAAVTTLDQTPDTEQRDTGDAGQHPSHSDRKLLHAIFQEVPVALFLLGKDGTVRRANLAAAELIGAAPGYATGRPFSSMIEPAARAAVRSQIAAAARTAESQALTCGLYGPAGTRQCQLAIRTVSVRGEEDRLLLAATPSQASPVPPSREAAGSEVDQVVVAMTRRLDAVTAVNKMLLENAASSEALTLQRFARFMADTVATWAIIDTVDQGTLHRHCIAGPDHEDSAGRAQAVMAVEPQAGSVPVQVLSSGGSLLLAHPEDEEALGVTDTGVPLLLLLGGACLLCAPITADGICHGTVTLVRDASAGTFGLADTGLAEDAAEQLARTIAVQRTMRQRTEAAEALQGSMLPREPKQIPGVEIAAAHMAPTLGREVGGDFYDIYSTPDGWGIAIGDVVGKGQDAAAVTAAARHAIRVLGHWNPDPAAVLRGANEIMLAEAFGGRFVTADAAHLSWRDGSLRVILGSAGHPGPVLVKHDGRAQMIEGGGEPLGIFPDGEAAVSELDLSPGDVLFFCTDGLTGARSPELGYFGERLSDALAGLYGKTPSDIISSLQRMLVDFCDNVLLDHVTMLALRVGAAPASR